MFQKGQLAWNKGIDHLSPEAKLRISQARKEWYKTHDHPRGMKGKQHTQQVKDQIAKTQLKGLPRKRKYPQGYEYGHIKVRLVRGVPKICEFCGGSACEWANVSGNYEDPNDYKAACRSCHKKFDKVYLKRKRNKLGRFI